MTRDDIIRMAREAGFVQHSHPNLCDLMISSFDDLERFAELVVAAEREKVARWMLEHSYATGHGDTIEDLLKELEGQV